MTRWRIQKIVGNVQKPVALLGAPDRYLKEVIPHVVALVLHAQKGVHARDDAALRLHT
jgi:hypothetical protein